MRAVFRSPTRAWPPRRRLQRGALFVSASSLLGVCYGYATVAPATGYEPSVVTPYSTVFWVLSALVLIGSIVVIVGDAAHQTGYWRFALPLSLSNYLLFVFIPEFREYALYGRGHSDVVPHFGYVKGIVNAGELPAVNGEILWYPAAHLLSAELTLLGLPLSTTKYLLAFVFISLYILGIALLLSVLLESRRAFLLGLAVGIPLLLGPFHVGFYPHLFSFSLLPVVIAILERYRKADGTDDFWLFFALAAVIVVFHPMTLILLLVIVSVTAFVSQHSGRVFDLQAISLKYTSVLVLGSLGIGWYVRFDRTRWKFQSVLESVTRGSRAPAAAELGKAGEAVLSYEQILTRFVQLYGMLFVYIVIAGIIAAYLVGRAYSRRPSYAEGLLVFQFGVGIAIAMAFLGTDLLATGPVRVSRYMAMFAALLLGLGFVKIMNEGGATRRVVSILLVSSIIVAAVLGAGAVYKPNKHMTYAEADGTEFVLTERVDDGKIWSYKGDKDMQVYTLGADSPHATPSDFLPSEYVGFYRLGYDDNRTAAQTFGTSYLVTKAHDRFQHEAQYYFPAQREAQFLYNETQLEQLRNDPTAEKFYDNGGLESWRITNRSAESVNQSGRDDE